MADINPQNSTKTIDDEAKQRKIISKLCGKGNKTSNKIRELDKISTDLSSCDDNGKPLAVVKPILVTKSGVLRSVAADRTQVDSETTTTATGNERTNSEMLYDNDTYRMNFYLMIFYTRGLFEEFDW